MIGRLRGIVSDIEATSTILDVHGVGYLVSCSGKTLSRLPPAGHEATLVVETHVREDEIRLFGFHDAAERDAFRVLQSVQGVGAKVALGILSIMTPSDVASAVSFQEKGMFTKVPGVGPKLAERLLVELKSKVAQFGIASVEAAGKVSADPRLDDAVSALVHLGYAKDQAAAAVVRAAKESPDAKVEALIRKGLQTLAA